MSYLTNGFSALRINDFSFIEKCNGIKVKSQPRSFDAHEAPHTPRHSNKTIYIYLFKFNSKDIILLCGITNGREDGEGAKKSIYIRRVI